MYNCSSCGIGDEWNGKPITLQLDHINGVNNDHRLDNLRMLCPNCHSQTDTWCGRNK
ncbi:MAG: HNH endonuclease [Pseudomonadales bacterium]